MMGQEIFWQNFGRFGPFPVGVTQRSSGVQNLKMLQMTFHVYQITREVIRITKIYTRKFLSNRIGASKRDIWTRVGNVIAPS